MAQDGPVPVLLSHLLRLKGAASIICFLFSMFHFFFFLLNLVFSQITSIDIFSLPENIDKKFPIPIIIFCCSDHGSSSSNRVFSLKQFTPLELDVQFCSFVLTKSSFICFVGLVNVKLMKANAIISIDYHEVWTRPQTNFYKKMTRIF